VIALAANPTAVETLGKFIGSTRYEDLERADQMRVKIHLLNAVGSVFAAVGHVPSELAVNMARRLATIGPSSFWQSDARGSIEDCAFVNSILTHSALLDDTSTHTGAIAIPPALAVSEATGRSGSETLTAIAIAYEVAARIEAGHQLDKAVSAQGFRHSWPAVFGATAASAYLMGLAPDKIGDALALTCTLCVPGTMAWFSNQLSPEAVERVGRRGTSERYLQIAANAKMAAFATSLARDGFCGTAMALEGANGLYSVYTNNASLAPEVLRDLGRVWHLKEIGVKAYPGSQVLPIYAAERLVRENSLDFEDMESITVRTSHRASYAGMTDQGPFTNAEQALVSFPFGIAATLIYGNYDMAVLLSAVGDPRVDALAQDVQIELLPEAKSVAGRFSELIVKLRNGRIVTADTSNMPEQILRPSDWEFMVARFHKMAEILPQDKRDCIANEVLKLDLRQDCGGLINMLRWTVESPSVW
jgi:2-methylcitrate dehydratase PrpD